MYNRPKLSSFFSGVSVRGVGERQRGPKEQHPALPQRPVHPGDQTQLQCHAVGRTQLLWTGTCLHITFAIKTMRKYMYCVCSIMLLGIVFPMIVA